MSDYVVETGAGGPRATGPLVMKFGGTSVADAARIAAAASLVRSAAEREPGRGVLVVLSACSGVTDELIACARLASSGDATNSVANLNRLLERHRAIARGLFRGGVPVELDAALDAASDELGSVFRGAALLRELPPRSLDLVAGRGEILSSRMLSEHAALMLAGTSIEAVWIDARDYLLTDSRYGCAKPDEGELRLRCEKSLAPLLASGAVVVTQGYIGADASGSPTTLGRGGSDYSASLFGAALGASEIQIWTDVEGVLSCDPRVVPGALPVDSLDYDEAAELAAFGAKVLHPATILPAVERGIPVTVRDSRFPDGRFTTISRDASSGRPVTAIASRAPVTVLTLRSPRMLGGVGFLARIFEAFNRHGVSVDVVSTSEVAVSVTVEGDADIDDLVAELSTFSEARVERDRAIVALVGDLLKKTPGIAGEALSALGELPVEMISLSANEINLSIVLERSFAREALVRLHAAFFGPAKERAA